VPPEQHKSSTKSVFAWRSRDLKADVRFDMDDDKWLSGLGEIFDIYLGEGIEGRPKLDILGCLALLSTDFDPR
jgi:hypothetical protein